MERILEDEERWYGEPRTGVNRNRMQHEVYNFRNVGFCMMSRAIYNTAIWYFFSMNLFRCLDFNDLENFLQDVRHVHMIDKSQVVWKCGYKGGIKAITKGSAHYRTGPRGWRSYILSLGMRLVRLCSPRRRGDCYAKWLSRRNGRCTWMVRRSVCSRRVSS